jgi:hypothetical protein
VKQGICLLCAVGMVLACGALVYAVAMDLPNRGPVFITQDLPAGVSELVSSRDRVHGFTSGFGYADLWYAGDAAAFNQYLAQYAQLPKLPIILVISPAPGSKLREFVSQPREHYDWQLEVKWNQPIPLSENRTDRNAEGYAVILHVYLSDAITLDDIQVPAGVQVRSGGEIEQFVKQHQGEGIAGPPESR